MNREGSWKEVILANPGPNSWKEAFILALKGVCMGTADIIPGVSGGTIALITGIYEKLLNAIKSINMAAMKKLLRFDIKGAVSEIHLRFLLVIFIGIALALVSLARLMHFLLNTYPELTFSTFFGLIAASIFIVGKKVSWDWKRGLSVVLGAVLAYLIVGLIPVETPTSLIFIFLSGLIAICAMILPGLSGAFLLLILGKYEFITGSLKSIFSVNEVTGLHNILIILVFCVGCFFGLFGFSRFLKWLLAKWYNGTLAFLTGLMIGSMRKIWPWKGETISKIIRGNEKIISQENIFPESLDGLVLLSIGLMVVGFISIVLVDNLSGKD